MFGKKASKPQGHIDTLIGAETSVQGNIEFRRIKESIIDTNTTKSKAAPSMDNWVTMHLI